MEPMGSVMTSLNGCYQNPSHLFGYRHSTDWQHLKQVFIHCHAFFRVGEGGKGGRGEGKLDEGDKIWTKRCY